MDEETTLESVLEYFRDIGTNGHKAAKIDADELNDALRVLEENSKEGLAAEDIELLLDAVFNSRMKVLKKNELLFLLVPETSVPEHVVMKVLVWFISNRMTMPVTLVRSLLHWATGLLEHDLVDSTKKLECLQEVLFFMLSTGTRYITPLCRLISKLTTSNHVTKSRVRELVRLHKSFGQQNGITYILGLYKLLRPDLVPIDVPVQDTRTAFGTFPDKLGLALRSASNRKHLKPNDYGAEELEKFVFAKGSDEICSPVAKKKRDVEILPVAAHVSLVAGSKSKKTLFQCQNISDFIHNLDCLELPNEVASLMRSVVGHSVIASNPNKTCLSRLNMWLETTLTYEFCEKRTNDRNPMAAELLDAIIEFQNYVRQSIPAVYIFLKTYLIIWNGRDCLYRLLQLLEWLPIMEFTALYQDILLNLEKVFLVAEVEIKCSILLGLTKTLKNMVEVEYVRHIGNQANVFPLVNFSKPIETVKKMSAFVAHLCETGLREEQENLVFRYVCLNFYREVGYLQLEAGFYEVLSVPLSLLYQGLLAPNPLLLEKICSLLPMYKELFSSAVSNKNDDSHLVLKLKTEVQIHNKFTYDLCRVLGSFLDFKTKNQQTFLFKRVTVEDMKTVQRMANTQSILSFRHHVGFLGSGLIFKNWVRIRWNDKKKEEQYNKYLSKLYPCLMEFYHGHIGL